MSLTKKDVIWSYLGVAFKIGINIMLLPILLFFLSGDELGLWYIYASLGAIIALLDLGFAPTISRNIAYAWSGANEISESGIINDGSFTGPNYVLLANVIKICRIIYGIIAIIAALIMIFAGTIYIIYVTKEADIDYIYASWIIYILGMVLSIYYSYFNSLLKGIGAIYEYNFSSVISKVVQIILSAVLLFFGFGILALAIAFILSGFTNRYISRKYFFSKTKMKDLLIPSKIKGKFTYELFRVIWSKSWRDGIVSVSGYMSTQLNTIIISLYLPLNESGIFSLSMQLVTIIIGVSSTLYNSYQPKLQQLYVKRDINNSIKIFGFTLIVYSILFLVGTFGLIAVGFPLISFISPQTKFNLLLVIAMSIYYFMLQHHKLFASYISNTNSVIYYKAFVLSSLFGVILSVIMLEYSSVGVWALIIGPGIVELFYNNWKWPLYVANSINTSVFNIYKEGFRYAKSIICSIYRRNSQNRLLK